MTASARRRERLIDRVVTGYRAAYGEEPAAIYSAPGRVNLIGEHLDYNDGFVLPCAIDRETIVAIGPSASGAPMIEAIALDMESARDRFALDKPIVKSGGGWQDLLRGVVAYLQKGGHTVKPAQMAIAGDVPIGAGLSSSASFAVATGLALTRSSAIAVTMEDIARIAQEAEINYLGTACGIMDQMASAVSTKGAALLLDCRTLDHRPAAVSNDLALVIIDSGIRRELASSAFNQRRAQCEQAAAHFNVPALRDLDRETLENAQATMDTVLYRRARHVVSEIERVEPATRALAAGDTAALAGLMRASHQSLRDDFEVSVEPIDNLVEIIASALDQGGQPLGGVRMTGGGFGGCLVALVQKEAAHIVVNAVETGYNPVADIPANAAIYQIAGGAGEVTF